MTEHVVYLSRIIATIGQWNSPGPKKEPGYECPPYKRQARTSNYKPGVHMKRGHSRMQAQEGYA